jgi:lysophospholipase L1-like esterase
MKLQRFRTLHKDFAIIVLNTLLLLVLLNIFFFVFYWVSDRPGDLSISEEQWQSLQRVYEGFSRTEIRSLQIEMGSRTFMYDPYTEFKERPYTGKYLTVDAHGFRPFKNQGPWPPNKDRYLTVFLFGGSTTFGYGVPDDQTIASYLQEYLSQADSKREVRVYNFACESYYSTQERILFEQQIKEGTTPDVAIFIDGLNDFWFYNDRPLFDENFERFFDGKLQEASLPQSLQKLPMLRAARSVKAMVTGQKKPTLHTSIEDNEIYNNQAALMNVIEHYVKNKEMIEALASAREIKTVFVWQPISTYKFDPKFNLFARDSIGERDYAKGYPVMAEFLKEHSLGNNFLWAADMQEHATEPLYVDTMHYSGKMSKMIAKFIYDGMIERNLFSFNSK